MRTYFGLNKVTPPFVFVTLVEKEMQSSNYSTRSILPAHLTDISLINISNDSKQSLRTK